MLSPLLYSLFTHDCTARHDSKFADDTTVVGRITNNDKTAYREEVRDLAMWCKDNNLSLNVIKTKEMIVVYRKKRTEHTPLSSTGLQWSILRASSSLVSSHKTHEHLIKWYPDYLHWTLNVHAEYMEKMNVQYETIELLMEIQTLLYNHCYQRISINMCVDRMVDRFWN